MSWSERHALAKDVGTLGAEIADRGLPDPAAPRVMPSFRMRNRSVLGFSPSVTAALPAPLMRQSHRRSVSSMWRRSMASSV